MLKVVLLAILTVVISILLWCLYIFGLTLGWWSPLTRPASVSSEAVYVFIFGKSAAWFDCRVDEKRDLDVCSVWDEHGRLEVSGNFRLKDENHAARKAELRPSIVGPGDASGHSDVIYLFGPDGLIVGKELVRVGSRSERERFEVEIPSETPAKPR
jgi:hypothetical protein